MYEGKPLVLVIGGTDTGRTPIAAALLRQALGAGVAVRTAGVLAHEGEGPAPEAQLALDQIGIDLSRHISRPLRFEDHEKAELLLAVDRGTELVLFADFPSDPRVACLAMLADKPDVLDPHRMPLGVWVAAVRQLHDQVQAALPVIRERLGIADQEPLPFPPRKVERRSSASRHDPLVLGTGARVEWDHDQDMQRLMQLISGDEAPSKVLEPAETEPETGASHRAEAYWSDAADQQLPAEPPGTLDAYVAPPSEPPPPVSHATTPPAEPTPHESPIPSVPETSRDEHIKRMARMIEAAEEAPEIVDWTRLRGEIVSRLRAVARQAHGALDFAPAASLMIEGKLMQCATLPPTDALYLLRQSITQLTAPVSANDLATIGANMAEW